VRSAGIGPVRRCGVDGCRIHRGRGGSRGGLQLRELAIGEMFDPSLAALTLQFPINEWSCRRILLRSWDQPVGSSPIGPNYRRFVALLWGGCSIRIPLFPGAALLTFNLRT
jgi:hypothetical protein